jgi:hypothetical protein
MASPNDGSPGTIVPPAEPTEALDADDADPGQVEEAKARERQEHAGKYGSTPVTPNKPPETAEEKAAKTSWIEIELVDQNDQPVPGEPYRVTLSDNTVAEGTLHEKGFERLDGIPPGNCQVTFPNLDQDAWEKA